MTRAQKIILGCGIALVAVPLAALLFLLNFDWNRARPWLIQQVGAATGRPFDIRGRVDLAWHPGAIRAGDWHDYLPWPRLTAHQVVLGNAPWSKEPVMAQADEVSFSIGLLPLLEKKILIPQLALEAPQLTLERLQDGRANWLFEPSRDTGWELDLREVVLNKGWVHVMDGVKHADVRLDVVSIDPKTNSNYQLGWTVEGSFNGQKISGDGKAGSVMALRRQRGQYPVEAHLAVGDTTLDAHGTVVEPRTKATLDLQVRLSGASLSQLYPLIGIAFPETPAFVTEGRFTGVPNRRGGDWSYEDFKGRVGNSDLSGSLKYTARQPRPLLEGTLVSSYLETRDLGPLIGLQPPPEDKPAETGKKKKGAKPKDERLFPTAVFRADRWRSTEVDIQFSAKKIVRGRQLPIDHALARIRMQDGVFSLAPLKFNIAGGNVVSNIRLDGSKRPVKGDVKLSARGVKLQQVFPNARHDQPTLGTVNGDVTLAGTGDSVAELMASANGDVRAVVSDGTVSKMLLEQMGLNVSSMVATQLFGDEQVKLNCAVNDFELKKGVMRPRAAVIDTDEATVRIDGQINLGDEKLALKLEPESKGVRLMSFGAPILVSGTLKNPSVDVDRTVVAAKAASAVALGVLAPVAAAMLPRVHVGPGENSQCGTLLAQAGTRKPAKAVIGASGR
ncbi:AsmA family protein [Oxalobacteraceae bacterium OM1]|nr:AsmA family protein [Oxalobacteraceae bacterium OM1]